ncbi:hypothetical protein R3P38DRAFT_2775413 [Favolaschia claudopus]|uniref:Uncharacterized protein n=1 Tax=Favolaschia claudopus TaxID=2862362 RepID=A0AAW0BT37_9AGAR
MALGEAMQSNVGEGVAGATNDVKKSTTPAVDVSIHPKEREKERFKQSASGGRLRNSLHPRITAPRQNKDRVGGDTVQRVGDDTKRESINVGATREHAGTARRRDDRRGGGGGTFGASERQNEA